MVSMTEKINKIEARFLRKELPAFNIGDTIKMKIKVKEAEKVRLHPFEGTVIKKHGTGSKATFTVRKVTFGEGVERTFPFHAPSIEKIEVMKKGKVKRAKLYYLRNRIGKAAKVEERKSEELV